MTEGREDQIELLVRRGRAAHLADSVYRGIVPVGVAVLAASVLLTSQVQTTALRIWILVAAADLGRMVLANRVGRRVVATGAVALLLRGGVGTMLGWFTLVYVGIAVKLHRVLHRAVVSSASGKHENHVLAGQLQEFLNDRDPLTGLLNRRGFLARLEELPAEATASQRLAVVVGNIQQLAAVNALYGELVGDQLLMAFAARLSAAMGSSCTLARLSGDEFAVASLVGADEGSDVVRRPLQRTVADQFSIDGHRLQVELLVADQLGEVHRANELIVEATAGVRQARSRLRPTLHHAIDPIARRRELAEQLRRAIEVGDVHPWFQPIVDAQTRRLVGWEALARWVHPDGVIPPERFLPLATMTGLSGMLTDTVLDHALSFVARLRREAPGAATTMHVNMAPSDLRRERMVSIVANSLAGHDVDPESLVVELTEQSILELDVATAATMHALTALGVHIAIDDFGTGFSSLGHLLELPTRHLKIDRRFVSGLPEQRAASTLVQGVIGMARGMDLTTVAEGVETEPQAQMLQQLGCTQLQGYLIAPALPEFEAIALARRLSGARASGAGGFDER